MRTVMIAAAAVACLSFSAVVANATDLVNQDETAYTVSLTSADGTHDIEIAPASEIMGVCEGCDISVGGADPITAGADDVVVIIGGEASVQE